MYIVQLTIDSRTIFHCGTFESREEAGTFIQENKKSIGYETDDFEIITLLTPDDLIQGLTFDDEAETAL